MRLRLLAALLALLSGIPAQINAAELLKISVAIPGPGAASYYPIELIPKIGADKAENAEVKVLFSPGGPAALEQMLNNNTDFAVVLERQPVP